MTTMVLLRSDLDWEGLYIDGESVIQEHQISAEEAVILCLNKKVDTFQRWYLDYYWVEENCQGSYPRKLSELPADKYEAY